MNPFDPRSSFDRFVRAVCVRMMIVRALERIGLCIAIASAGCLVLLPVLLWRGEPVMPLALGAMAAAVGIGLLWGLMQRPTALGAAMEADRQFGLDDLLSSAWSIRSSVSVDPWARTVLQLASVRCRGLSPSALILNSFGARAWGGIGLAAALVFTLALMQSNPAPSRARSMQSDAMRSLQTQQTVPQADPFSSGSRGTSNSLTRAQAEEREIDHRLQEGSGDPDASRIENAQGADSAAGASDAAGAGQASSDARNQHLAARDPSASDATDALSATGETSAGGRSSDLSRAGEEVATGLTAAGAPPAEKMPAWESPGWPTDRERALQKVQEGKVPAQYQDLVREYFQSQE